MTGIFELHILTEGTTVKWKTPEALQSDRDQIETDFRRDWAKVLADHNLIKAVLDSDSVVLAKAGAKACSNI